MHSCADLDADFCIVFEDLVADSVKLCIILQSSTNFCIYHYNFTDMDADFCIVLQI